MDKYSKKKNIFRAFRAEFSEEAPHLLEQV